MFSPEFFPTPAVLIERMTAGYNLQGKKGYDPEGGHGNLVRYCQEHGAEMVASELDGDLRALLQRHCRLIGTDALKVTSDQISHVDFIIMNPPFSKGAEHVLHAWNIAPAGCVFFALVNLQTIKNPYSKSRQELVDIIEAYGRWEDIGQAFGDADRQTNVEVALIKIEKPGEASKEFEGFFMDEDPEQEQANGLISYNVVRDIVNRYVEAVKIFDQQLSTAVRLSEMTGEFYGGNLGFQVTRNQQPIQRNEFKKG